RGGSSIAGIGGEGESVMSEITPDQAMQLAMQRHQAGRTDQAEAICLEMLRRFPEHPTVLHVLGLFTAEMGRVDEAIELLARVVKVRPDWAEARHNLGFAYVKRG